MTPATEHTCLFYAVAIHREWQNPHHVARIYEDFRRYCFNNSLDLNMMYKRMGDYMRECFDREPKMRDVPLEQAMIQAEQFVNYWKQEM